MLKLKLQYLATWCEELTHWKRPRCWEGLGAGREGDDRGWDGLMASPTQWAWVSVSSGSWWWTGRSRVLRFMGLQRVRHDWMTKLNRTEKQFLQDSNLPCTISSGSLVFTARRAQWYLYWIWGKLYDLCPHPSQLLFGSKTPFPWDPWCWWLTDVLQASSSRTHSSTRSSVRVILLLNQTCQFHQYSAQDSLFQGTFPKNLTPYADFSSLAFCMLSQEVHWFKESTCQAGDLGLNDLIQACVSQRPHLQTPSP